MSSTDFSIVVPHRGNPLGLWATIQSCDNELEGSKFKYNYVVVINGEGEKLDTDLATMVHYFKRSPKVRSVIQHEDPLSPPEARQRGFDQADGKYIFSFDNHCLVSPGYFKRAIADFEHFDIDLLHSAYQFFLDDVVHYHYTLKLSHNFWGGSGFPLADTVRPCRIAAGGHGGFAVKRSSWEEVGGYGPPGLFQGYAGEEIYTDLKFWMMGKSVWIDPKVRHTHYAGKRDYIRHYSDDFYRNLMACANVIGGEEWLYKVYNSFSNPEKWVRHKSDITMFDLMVEAYKRSADHALWMKQNRQRSLEDLLEWFRSEAIPC